LIFFHVRFSTRALNSWNPLNTSSLVFINKIYEEPQCTKQVSMVNCSKQGEEHIHGTSISMVSWPEQNNTKTRTFSSLNFFLVILANTLPIHDTDNDQGGKLVTIFLNNLVDDEASIHIGMCPHLDFFITVQGYNNHFHGTSISISI
jgi:hypothetical protein